MTVDINIDFKNAIICGVFYLKNYSFAAHKNGTPQKPFFLHFFFNSW